jgi:DNA mismatch endonuclease (patch repair protein)
VFTRAKVAVFVDGCFWHGCPEHHTVAKANAEFWARKVQGNRDRDNQTNMHLVAAGWTVVRVWEHQPAKQAAEQIAEVVTETGRTTEAGYGGLRIYRPAAKVQGRDTAQVGHD